MSLRGRQLDSDKAALKCDSTLFILNLHKAFRLDDTLPSCQSRCHYKLGSHTTPDGGKIKKINEGELFITLAGCSRHKLHSPPHAGEFTCVAGATLRCHFLPAHLIKYCFITSRENVTNFAIFPPQRMCKKCELTCT